MVISPKQLGEKSIQKDILLNDKKNCIKFGRCGIGKKAIYLNNYFFDRIYYIPLKSVSRIFKRIAMSKGGFTGKGAFGTLAYIVVEYDNNEQKQIMFKHEEDIDRLLEYIKTNYDDISIYSKASEKKIIAKKKLLEEKEKNQVISEERKKYIDILEKAKDYLEKNIELYTHISYAAKKKRVYERSKPSYKWIALAIVLAGVCSFIFGIYSIITKASFGVYFLLFGLAAVLLFSSANVLPTSKNNKKYIENDYNKSIKEMKEYIDKYSDFPIPEYYAHPIVIRRMEEILKDGRADTIDKSLQLLKKDLKALNSSVAVEQEEYDEIVIIKPMFLVMNYK